MSFDDLPEGWTVWHDEPGGRGILAYRPDVFDTEAYPAPCLPTIYVSNAPRMRQRRPGSRPTGEWRVTLFLEPEIEAGTEEYDDRDRAVEGAVAVARRFADGGIDYRSLYQVPREAYFDRLDELTGRGDRDRDRDEGRVP